MTEDGSVSKNPKHFHLLLLNHLGLSSSWKNKERIPYCTWSGDSLSRSAGALIELRFLWVSDDFGELFHTTNKCSFRFYGCRVWNQSRAAINLWGNRTTICPIGEHLVLIIITHIRNEESPEIQVYAGLRSSSHFSQNLEMIRLLKRKTIPQQSYLHIIKSHGAVHFLSIAHPHPSFIPPFPPP